MNISDTIKNYKETKKQLQENQKQMVRDVIYKTWTKEEIDMYNMQFNTYAVPYGVFNQMTELDIKVSYLKNHRSLFTKEEINEMLTYLCVGKENTTAKAK